MTVPPLYLSAIDNAEALRASFWARVAMTDECWLWMGPRSKDGYGHTNYKGVDGQFHYIGAHRLSYLLEHGAIPENSHVAHTCDTPACVRPSHLFLTSHKGNMEDKVAKGRSHHPIGERNPKVRLKASQVRAIRAQLSAGETPATLAPQYGVWPGTIRFIQQGVTWKHLE